MAFNLEKDWPIVAAGGAAILGVILLSKRGLQPVVVGGGTPAGYSEAVEAQKEIAIASLSAQTSAYQTLVTEFGQTQRTRLEAESALAAIRAREETERQKASAGLFSSIITGIFGLFSWETTAAGERYRSAAFSRMRTAYALR